MEADTKAIYAEVPVEFYDRVKAEADKRGMKLVAVVRKALELWLAKGAK